MPHPLIALLSAALVAASSACGSSPTALPPFLCQACTADQDCGATGNRCLDLTSGAACGVDCSAAACPGGFTCASVTGGGRNCIPQSGSCPDLGPCGGGCTGGWSCDPASNSCVPPPGDGGAPDGPPAHPGPWPQVDGDVLELGDIGLFRFTVAGDVRPENPNGSYPVDVITRIFQQQEALHPGIAFFLGDYMFVSPSNYVAATQQLGFFLQARRALGAEVYYVLGNHEAYNDNLRAYKDLLVPSFYYALNAATPKGTVKFIVLADNRWEPSYQKPWAEAQLARPTTYTFVLHHYPSYASQDPSSGDVKATLAKYPKTLELAGHYHLYDVRSRVVTVGNAGAPLASARDFYGFLAVELKDDGQVTGTAYREDTGLPVDSFTVGP